MRKCFCKVCDARSELLKRMENSYEGDLSDIVGSSGTEWQPLPSNNPISYPSSDPVDDFGDPFTQFGDPLLHDIDTPSGFFHNAQGGVENIISSVVDSINQHKNNVADEMRSSSIFSRMLQISPKLQVPPRELNGPSMLLPNNNTINDRALISPNSSKIGLLESPSTAAGVQISSPRNTGIKRRKSQAKKVVCIPAPAPANSSSGTKPSGEVVPSDLWAWRKYGQKPIKGSPYPRGYYRCSSSKGCLARKQVERSRTDPNMLVITYTSEHNHPWPTQRNALAGSTRSHYPTSAAKDHSQKQLIINVPPDHKQEHNKDTCSIENPTSTAADHHVKQELLLMDQHFDNNDAHEFEQGSSQPTLFLESCEDSFFAEMGEIEADVPLDLLTFPLGSAGEENINNSKALDPFSFYDWPGTNTTTSHADAAKTDSS